MVEQYEVYWVELDPTRGGEMAKLPELSLQFPHSDHYPPPAEHAFHSDFLSY